MLKKDDLPTTLFLSGGNIKGPIQAGILKTLKNNGYLNDIDTYIGISIGSVICLLLNLNVDDENIIPLLYEIYIDQIIKKIKLDSLLTITDKYGLINIETLFVKIKKYIVEKYDKELTMKELYDKTEKTLEIITFNQSKQKEVVISYKTHPNLSCIKAIAMSCNIPLIFTKIEYKNDLYIDGVFAHYFPKTEKNIICVITTSKEDGINDIISYIYNIYRIQYSDNYDSILKDIDDNYNVIITECYDIRLLTKYKNKQIKESYNYGLNVGYKFMQSTSSQNNKSIICKDKWVQKKLDTNVDQLLQNELIWKK